MRFCKTFSSPIGDITIVQREGTITNLYIGCIDHLPGIPKNTELLNDSARQITDFLNGKTRNFNLPLYVSGTKFQMNVWDCLLKIPFGKTKSYADVAKIIGYPTAHRAVGNAVGRNPIPIIIPCHRVLAANGKIGGFSLGLPLKKKLLEIESVL